MDVLYRFNPYRTNDGCVPYPYPSVTRIRVGRGGGGGARVLYQGGIS